MRRLRGTKLLHGFQVVILREDSRSRKARILQSYNVALRYDFVKAQSRLNFISLFTRCALTGDYVHNSQLQLSGHESGIQKWEKAENIDRAFCAILLY